MKLLERLMTDPGIATRIAKRLHETRAARADRDHKDQPALPSTHLAVLFTQCKPETFDLVVAQQRPARGIKLPAKR